MKQKIFNTQNDYTGLIIRLAIGIVMWPHGARAMLGLCLALLIQGSGKYALDNLISTKTQIYK
ncbi:hypothetical protein [Flavihumibacter sp. UBA7668]|uniref:hypothetical protein n=1 Tax=Flavihumibacter sp. UBA7668 TaxID=1946542 RepID=UPI0025BA89E4|nr:hypothetical protein [Flavihumibacter sp. UBA7668]